MNHITIDAVDTGLDNLKLRLSCNPVSFSTDRLTWIQEVLARLRNFISLV